MGSLARAICTDNACGYSKELRYGPGWIGVANKWRFKERLLSGEENYPEAIKILKNDGELHSYGIYLCPHCKEYVTSEDYYCCTYISLFFEEYDYDGVDEEVYDIVFPFGVPECKNCGTELQYIDEDFFNSIKCPKCGGNAAIDLYGLYD